MIRRATMRNDDDGGIPATQPVLSLILQGVVAYVEVRSGHDNRSRGVKAQLRKLGADIEEKLNKDVTHVVFNEGLPSTYKKAKKFNCHLVSVLWIAACKEALSKVGEGGYPPIGQQIYEDPHSLKNFKKLKSMQPDFDDEVDEMKTEKIRRQIQRRAQKSVPDPNWNKSDDEGGSNIHTELNVPRSKTRGRKKGVPKDPATKKASNSKGRAKKMALKEITTDIVNKTGVVSDVQLETASALPNTAENLNTGDLDSISKSFSSSSSVIFCGEVEEAGPSNKCRKKASKIDDTPINRAGFVEGLNKIVLSLSEEHRRKKLEMSPWRKPVGVKKILPFKTSPLRRSSRYRTSSLLSDVSPGEGPYQDIPTIKKTDIAKKPAALTSASATIAARRKVAPLPTSPGDSFMLLSQEPGDMPSIDELAKMRRGSVRAGDERVTLSQVIRSYNAVAKRHVSSPATELSSSAGSSKAVCGDNFPKSTSFIKHPSRSSLTENAMINVEDISCPEELVVPSQDKCPSEAGSSASALSTRVLINGIPSEKAEKLAYNSDFLPGSEEMDELSNLEADTFSAGASCPVDEYEREPSPIFLIKKPKIRRPIKKPKSSSNNATAESSSSFSSTAGEGSQSKIEGASSEQQRESMNPIDYINKFFLPRFSLASKTPSNAERATVFVEETPDISNAPETEQNPTVIPPTPAENVPLAQKEGECVASPTQSLTSSVISWVKKSCKVPLFSSRANKAYQSPIPEETSVITSNNGITPLKEIYPKTRGSAKSSSKLETNASAILSSKSDLAAKPQQSSRKSPRNQQSGSPVKSVEPQKRGKRTKKQSGDMEGAPAAPPKTRRRVVKTVVNDEEGMEKPGSISVDKPPGPIPVVVVHKLEEIQLSSGYESSYSHGSGKADETKSGTSRKPSTEPSAKKTKLCDGLSSIPVNEIPKKRSEVYENNSPAVNEVSNVEDSAQKILRRKRIQSMPNPETKKRQKLEIPDQRNSPQMKTCRFSRADSKGLLEVRSKSDLSMDSSITSGRKSSEHARKRMAKSLTRNLRSDAPKVIVCTFLTTSEQNGIEAAGESLQGWKLEEKVTSRTTHVINSGPKRTLNMLKGMARGCWLVDQKWMLDSSKAACWLEEEKYELVQFSPAVKPCRMKRQALGKEFKHNLFSRAGPIFVSPKIEGPPAKDIRELLELCGANLATLQEAKIVITDDSSKMETVHCVQPRWVLDCITKNKILSLKHFQI